MEPAATVERWRTVEASHRSARSSEPVRNGTRPTGESRTAVEAGVTPVSRMTPISVVPRAGADEDSTDEPIRTVVAVWRARVRRIRVIAVGANRSWTDVRRANANSHGPNSHANSDANLRLR